MKKFTFRRLMGQLLIFAFTWLTISPSYVWAMNQIELQPQAIIIESNFLPEGMQAECPTVSLVVKKFKNDQGDEGYNVNLNLLFNEPYYNDEYATQFNVANVFINFRDNKFKGVVRKEDMSRFEGIKVAEMNDRVDLTFLLPYLGTKEYARTEPYLYLSFYKEDISFKSSYIPYSMDFSAEDIELNIGGVKVGGVFSARKISKIGPVNLLPNVTFLRGAYIDCKGEISMETLKVDSIFDNYQRLSNNPEHKEWFDKLENPDEPYIKIRARRFECGFENSMGNGKIEITGVDQNDHGNVFIWTRTSHMCKDLNIQFPGYCEIVGGYVKESFIANVNDLKIRGNKSCNQYPCCQNKKNCMGVRSFNIEADSIDIEGAFMQTNPVQSKQKK